MPLGMPWRMIAAPAIIADAADVPVKLATHPVP
jgi:hypothetical protein